MHGKPILCLDFDGVIHSYKSGWVFADFIPDPPVPGAFEFIYEALEHFDVQVFSSRSHQTNGIRAMQMWTEYWAKRELDNVEPTWRANHVVNNLAWRKEAWPKEKPPAVVGIDDRVLTFTGAWPEVEDLRKFKPWNK
jgi:hypothetical protein